VRAAITIMRLLDYLVDDFEGCYYWWRPLCRIIESDAEIQVGLDIYKYTDVGLFIVDEERYTVLNDYLDIKVFQMI
jgi:hypothetical protein